MYTHVSMFRFRSRENLEQTRELIRQRLQEFPAHIPEIRTSRVLDNCMPHPDLPAGGPQLFCDLIQIVTFDSRADLEKYPRDPWHQTMVQETDHLVERVCILDYEG